MSSPPLELGQGGSPHLWREEIIVIFSLAIPTIAQTASQQLMLTTDQIFLGHIGTLELAAAALGLTFSNIQLFFLMGAASALDTLGAQAFGADNHPALVAISYTSAVVLSLLCIPIGISLSFGKLVAGTLFGQEKVVSNLVGVYCRGLIPGLIPMMLSLVLMKYLQSQNEVIAPAAATIITFFLNILFNFAFIAWFGFTGSALATSFARFCQFLMLCVAVLLFEAKRKASLGSTASKALGLDGDDEATSLLQADGSPSAVDSAAPEKESSQQTASDGTAAVLLMVPPSSTDSTNSTDSTKEYQGSVGLIRSLSSKGLSAMRRQLSWFPLPSSPAAAGGGGGDNGDGTSPWGAGTEGSGPSRKQSGVGAYIAGVWHTIVGETKLALQPHILMRFARLAVPGGVMMMFEAGSFEVTTVFASRLGPTVTAAHACMLAIIVLTYFSGPFAIGIAASIRVGNLVGAGKPELAKLSAKISVYIATFMMAIFGLIILLTRHHLGKIFTADPEVIAVFASIAPMAALFQISDGIWGTAQGVLRGCGRQRELLIFTLIGFWLIGMTLGYVLAFPVGLGVQGIWWGISAGDTTTMILGIIAMLRIRWSDEVKRAKEQVKSLARGGQDESPVGAVDRQGAGYLMPDDLNTSVHAAPWSPYQAGVSGERGLAGQGLELVDGPRLPKISEEFSRPPEGLLSLNSVK